MPSTASAARTQATGQQRPFIVEPIGAVTAVVAPHSPADFDQRYTRLPTKNTRKNKDEPGRKKKSTKAFASRHPKAPLHSSSTSIAIYVNDQTGPRRRKQREGWHCGENSSQDLHQVERSKRALIYASPPYQREPHTMTGEFSPKG